MYYVYVLFSEKYIRYYKGFCQNINRRLKEHNSGHTKSAKLYIPWMIDYYEIFDNKQLGIKREKYFKSAAGKRFLKRKLTK